MQLVVRSSKVKHTLLPKYHDLKIHVVGLVHKPSLIWTLKYFTAYNTLKYLEDDTCIPSARDALPG